MFFIAGRFTGWIGLAKTGCKTNRRITIRIWNPGRTRVLATTLFFFKQLNLTFCCLPIRMAWILKKKWTFHPPHATPKSFQHGQRHVISGRYEHLLPCSPICYIFFNQNIVSQHRSPNLVIVWCLKKLLRKKHVLCLEGWLCSRVFWKMWNFGSTLTVCSLQIVAS